MRTRVRVALWCGAALGGVLGGWGDSALAGSLTATYPAAIALPATQIGASGSLVENVNGGAIVVSDLRLPGSCGAWSTTATLSSFSDGLGHSLAASSVSVSPGPVIAAVTNSPGTSASPGAGGAFSSSGSVTFMSASGSGCGTFGLNPTFTWQIPAQTYAAANTGSAYTATMTFTTQ